MKEEMAKRLTFFKQVLKDLPSVLFLHAWNKYQWRKENRDDLFISRLAIRSLSLAVVLTLVFSVAFQNSSSAVVFTWEQTDWSNGVGSSTSNQYSSVDGIDASESGSFQLSNLEKTTNSSFNTDLSDWSSDSSETVPTVIQTATLFNGTATSNFAITFPRPVTPGNSIVVLATYRTNAGTVSGDGYTTDASHVNTTSNNERIYVLRKVVQSGDSNTVTISNTVSSTGTFHAYEVSGISTVNPVDRVSSGHTTNSTSYQIPTTQETTTDNQIAFAAMSSSGSNSTPSWNNGFILSSTASNNGFVGYKELTTKQEVSATFTSVTTRVRAGLLITYKGGSTSETNDIPVTVRQAQSAAVAAGTSRSAVFPFAPKKGNTLFIALTLTGDPGTITLPSGWVQVFAPRSPSTGSITALYMKTAGENEPTSHLFSWEISRTPRIDVYEVQGLQPTDVLDESNVFYNIAVTTTVTQLIPSFAPSASDTFLLMAAGISTTTGPPNNFINYGFSNPTGSADSVMRTGFRFMGTPETLTIPFSSSSSRTAQGFIASFKTLENYVNTERDTSIKYAGAASARFEATPWVVGRFTQSVNVGDGEDYKISTYVYNDNEVVDDSVAELYYNGSTVATNYEDVGDGWYRLSATVAGANEDRDFGLEIQPGETVHVDNFGINRFATTGTLTSNIFDTGSLSNWGEVRYSYSGNGTVSVKIRSSNDPDMSTAQNFSSCADVDAGDDISTNTNGCVTDAERYIQYQITITGDTDETPVFEEIEIDYKGADETAPEENASDIKMYKSNGGNEIVENGWTNSLLPYFTWESGVDNTGGVGIAGYCVYLGTSSTADPITTKGLLGEGDLEVYDQCPFATANDYLDLAAPNIASGSFSTSNAPYYLLVKAIDANYNIYDDEAASFHFRFDNTAPNAPAYINAPSSFISSKTATMTWPTSGPDAPVDANSGVAGLQYKIGPSGTWYGDDHSGAQDSSDLLDNDGNYTTQDPPDFDSLIEGSNVIYFRTWDQAGNVSVSNVTTSLKINTAGAPSSPQNIEATPSVNTQNSFAFSWGVPATYVGNVNNLTYCYTVNTLPTVSNCTFTSAGQTSIPAGAYATQPGVNTLYVVAKDESGSINYATAGSVEFTANTAAPGLPLNPDLADTSVKASSNWRLVISWETPGDVGAGVSKYDIYRSTNGTDFTKAGSTSGTSYVDTSLSQTLYYYKVRACDSANNCGAYSQTVEKTPTGRFTSPPTLTSAGGVPRVEDIETRSATISWSTDRNGDSKVAYGLKTGEYGATEAYKSTQTTDHEVKLTNLVPGTTYYFVTRWTDTDGNTGTSTELVFQTLPPPVVQDVVPAAISLNSATLQYTTSGASAVKIYYGPSSGFGAAIDVNTSRNVSTYTTQLPDLQDGTKYFYKINTFDANGNEYDGTTLSFETPPAPRIVNLRFQPVENEPSSTQMVSWETNVPTTSEISYGVAGGETLNAIDTTMTTTHEIIIRQLADDSQYTLIARSRDSSGNVAVSDSQVFRTALDTRAPKITDITVTPSIRGTGAEARGQIIITWKTDEPATSQVAYGEGTSGDLSNSSSQDSRLTYDHAVVISDLSTSKVYRVQPVSYDKGNNEGAGDPQTAIVGRSSQSALSIIFSVLQKIFGVN